MGYIKRRMNNKKLGTVIKYMLFIVLVVIVLSVFLSSYFIWSDIVITDVQESRMDVLGQMAERLNTLTEGIEVISNLIYYDSNTKMIVEANPRYMSDTDRLEYFATMKNVNQSYMSVSYTLDVPYYFVMICDNTFNYVSEGKQDEYDFEKIKSAPWIEQIYEAEGSIVQIAPYKDTVKGEQNNSILFARSIKSQMATNSGLLIIGVDETDFRQYYGHIQTQGEILIANSSGDIISCEDSENTGKNVVDLFDGISHIDGQLVTSTTTVDGYIFSQYVTDTDMVIIERIPLNSLLSSLNEGILVLAGITLVIFILSFFFFTKVTKNLTTPFSKLCDNLEAVSRGEFDTRFSQGEFYEINVINNVSQNMVGQIKGLIENVKTTEAQKRDAEIKFLQAQINPHFMYNTLFSIKCLADMNQSQKVLTMLDAYIRLLRLSFDDKGKFDTVRNTVAFLKDYISLMNYRYGEKVVTTFEVEEEIGNSYVLRFLVQPLIENAIFHGMSPEKQTFNINISFRKSDDFMVIVVQDDGVGMEYDNKKKPKSSGIGMINVKERLRLNYGERCSFSVNSQKHKGTTVTIQHPILWEEDQL